MLQKIKPIEYKFILLGDSSVGKSAIFTRLSGKNFNEETTATIGISSITINFENVEINKKEKIYKNFKILLFDTAGQERYKAITKTYFRDSQGIILIYSIDNAKSFEHIQLWLESIKESLSDWKRSGYIVMLLGNKSDIAIEDMEKRAVLYEEAQRLCSEQDIYWGGECSAKTFDEDQMKEIFQKFMKQIYLKLKEEEEYNRQERQVSKVMLKPKKKKKICCNPSE